MKKILTILLTAVLMSNMAMPFSAYAAPEAPSAPDAPSAPEAPDAPNGPSNNDEDNHNEDNHDEDDEEQNLEENTDQSAESNPENTDTTNPLTTEEDTNINADNQTGDTEIETGDATNTSQTLNTGNNNLAGTDGSAGTSDGGVTIANQGNGSGSDNEGSVAIDDSSTLIQDNDANVDNSAEQSTVTGNNSASGNTGGNVQIETGDANTSGTIANFLNTNAAGVMVSEFNIADDHLGDYVLDFDANCISGCGGSTAVTNTGNGSDSTNSGTVDITSNDQTFQTNDAYIENEMILLADSGNNTADANTGGNSTINTGDANVAANILNFANTNLAGNVIYGVVNVFGDLIGDIIFPEEYCGDACNANVALANTNNGSDSTNTGNYSETDNSQTFQLNDAVIDNNILLDATTGENETSGNTNGNSSIETGDVDLDVNTMNVVNSNLNGGNWFLVLVNEAGNWVGKILGGDGSNMAGSPGTEFNVDQNGDIFVTNNANGSGSTNAGNVNVTNNDTLVQDNQAHIVNNLDLTANSGNNSTSNNTGGDNSITTGDANVVANIVNFVNNNIAGDGKLFVTVVNVFGSWTGNFKTPWAQEEEQTQEIAQTNEDPSNTDHEDTHPVGGTNDEQENSQENDDEDTTSNTTAASTDTDTSSSGIQTFSAGQVAGALAQGKTITVHSAFNEFQSRSETADVAQKMKINLAWLLVLIPAGGALYLGKKIRARLAR
ncbi:MAG: hypothetical protein NUV98_05405 [Candidatus Roizmanbacteria bacterium]|nr:hypothetical protein [Candidatus Roizmanbacteria bacterium]